MKILHLQLEDEIHRKLKLISMNSDMSMKDTVVELINKKWDTKKAPLSDFPNYKQEYIAPPVETFADGSHGYTLKSTKKNNSLAKAKQEAANLQAQQAIDQKRMKMDGLEFCKAGHILSSNGKCLQKDCRYA